MRNSRRNWKFLAVFLLLVFFAAGTAVHTTEIEVQAATKDGFKTVNGKSYYYKNGKKVKGWLTLKGKKYYFNTSTGVQVKGWTKDNKGRKRYFTSKAGAMVTGWLSNSKGQKRYFDPSTGYMSTRWKTINKKKYYFYSNTGIAAQSVFLTDSKKVKRYFTSKNYMATGWVNFKAGKRYFDPATGQMAAGFKKLSNKTYYFYRTSGLMATGWVENKAKGIKYYFYKNSKVGQMATGIVTIDGKKYEFGSDGILIGEIGNDPKPTTPTADRTIKNFLANALKPVGQTLYVWGGGHNYSDATRKGVSSRWKQWYTSQSSSYNYRNYMDLSETTEQKGLDCSGFVGWSVYQIMEKASGGNYYTTVAEDVGATYRDKGMGTIISQAKLAASNYKLYPGDIGYNSGHTWIVLGQCSDKSIVILHSTPNAGVQISGTPTPSGNYNSRAIELAEIYMAKYSGSKKYDYHESSGNYIRNGAYFRWNTKTLSDPNGYLKKTADQILADLF